VRRRQYGHRTVRQLKRIAAVQRQELDRRAHLYIARNTTLPTPVRRARETRPSIADRWLQTRLAAQLALANLDVFPKQSRPHEVKSRCIASDAGRAVQARQTGLNRVRLEHVDLACARAREAALRFVLRLAQS